jgi:hypothetical protein
MNITPEQVRDYEACPRFYDYSYGEEGAGVKLSKRQQLSAEFMDTIKRVANYYFYKKQAYNDPTLKSLYNRWQKDWFGDTTVSDIAKMQNSVQQRSRTSFSSRAVEIIKDLFEDFSDVTGDQVFWLNESYIVPILDQKAILEGTVDLVIRQKDKNRFHIFKWANSNESTQSWQYELAAAEYAFRYRYSSKEMDTRHYLWHLYGPRTGRQQIELEKKDFDLFGYNADKLVNDKLFVPRYGYSTYCKSCPYTSKCVKWQMPREEKTNVK